MPWKVNVLITADLFKGNELMFWLNQSQWSLIFRYGIILTTEICALIWIIVSPTGSIQWHFFWPVVYGNFRCVSWMFSVLVIICMLLLILEIQPYIWKIYFYLSLPYFVLPNTVCWILVNNRKYVIQIFKVFLSIIWKCYANFNKYFQIWCLYPKIPSILYLEFSQFFRIYLHSYEDSNNQNEMN